MRLLVNDALSALPEHRTFWHDLRDWIGADFCGAPYDRLAEYANEPASKASLIVRNASYFPPIAASATVPTISLVQDIFTEGPVRDMQDAVILSSKVVVFNSVFTMGHYAAVMTSNGAPVGNVIPLPVDFKTFAPGNPMGLQQFHSLPDNCVIWVGARSEIKGYDIFTRIVRMNPDISFVAVFKDDPPEYVPMNMRVYSRIPQDQLASLIGACRVGLCTSRNESQHLAGIEMGACGLPVVVPPVGAYWNRESLPGFRVDRLDQGDFVSALRQALSREWNTEAIRSHWKTDFSPDVIRPVWAQLAKEVEG